MLNNVVALLGNGAAASTPSFESIATVTVGSGGTTSISFSSIPSTYTHLQIRGIAKTTTGASGYEGAVFRFNSDSGTNYSNHQLAGNGSGVSVSGSASNTKIENFQIFEGNTSYPNVYSAFIIDILDYTNTNKYKTVRYYIADDDNGQGTLRYASACWQSTNAITNVSFSTGPNLKQYTQFALYGIKGA